MSKVNDLTEVFRNGGHLLFYRVPEMIRETGKEYTQDVVFGLTFLMIALLAGWRMVIYFDPNGGGKATTAFYALILGCASMRSIWFLIPKSALEGSYAPIPAEAFVTPLWSGALFSQILVSLGSLCLYSVFILIICYWANMLRKVEHVEGPESSQLTAAQRSLARYPRTPKRGRGPMLNFTIIMSILMLLEIMNIIAFLLDLYNADGMMLLDSVLMSIISIVSLIEISIFSHRIRFVMMTIGVINANSTKPQVRRILAFTIAANIFFSWRMLLEVILMVIFLYVWRMNKALYVVFSHQFWDVYINTKHWSEVVVLVLELVISTAKKTPVTAPPAAGNTVRIRRRDYQRINEMKATELRPQIGNELL